MNYPIRQLVAADLSVLKELLLVFGKAFVDIDTYQKAVPSDRYLTSFLGKDHVFVLVATHEDKVIGGLVAYALEKFEQERAEIYIYDLAVSEEFRRQGVATALIHELKAVGKKHGAYVIFVQADPGDAPAISLYESLGVREEVYHFDINI